MNLIKKVTAAWEKRIVKYPFLFKLYSLPYKNILQREIALAGITAGDRVLNIGCGSVPFTAIYTAEITGAEVVGLDFDSQACKKARTVVAEMDLDRSVTIVEGNGVDTDPSQFTVILVALQAIPKEKLLTNLMERAKPGLRMVFRLPRSVFEKEYGTLSSEDNFAETVSQYMITFNRSVLVQKK